MISRQREWFDGKVRALPPTGKRCLAACLVLMWLLTLLMGVMLTVAAH